MNALFKQVDKLGVRVCDAHERQAGQVPSRAAGFRAPCSAQCRGLVCARPVSSSAVQAQCRCPATLRLGQTVLSLARSSVRCVAFLNRV